MAKCCMPLMRIPGARIAVLAGSDTSWHTPKTMLADDLTTMVRYRSGGDLTGAERPESSSWAER